MDRPIPPATSDEEARLLALVSSLAIRSARRLVKRGLEDRDVADDLAQQVVLDCFVRLRTGRWRVRSTLEGLVASMVWRKHALGKRGEQRRQERDALHLADREAQTPVWMNPAERLDERENDAIFQRALFELPVRRRNAYLLVNDEGATYREASARLGISCGLVFSDVATAERHLAERLLGTQTWNGQPSNRRRSRWRRHARPNQHRSA